MNYIYDANSFDTAIQVEKYPWGFRLKTKRKYWIETTKNGDRSCFQTLNPKTNMWCAVKKSTYEAVKLLYQDEKGHVQSHSIHKYGVNKKEIENFLSEINYELLNKLQQKQICKLKAVDKVMENVTWKITKTAEYNLSDPGDLARMKADHNSPKEQQERKEQEKIKGHIAGAIHGAYNQCLTKNKLK